MANTRAHRVIEPPEPEPLDEVLRFCTTKTAGGNARIAAKAVGKRTLSDYLREVVDQAVERDLKEWRERESRRAS